MFSHLTKVLVNFFLFVFVLTSAINAQEYIPESHEFFRARVEQILTEGQLSSDTGINPFQEVKLKILDGSLKNQEFTTMYGQDISLTRDQLVKTGDTVVVVKTLSAENLPQIQITDKYRLKSIYPILAFFFVIVIILSRWQGAGSILGMAISLAVILKYIVPGILAGKNPLTVSIIGCLIIMIFTIYLAHGFSAKISIAVLATFITLVSIGLLSVAFVSLSSLTGLGSEDAASLRFGVTENIDFRGLLLGGILIGALGVLDDVTTSLSASVFELAKANPLLKFKDLFTAGLSIGREHIASLVNTLVLAYAGSALPIFLMVILNVNNYPLWLILNDGLILEEVIRTLAGSIGLVAAVPLTTFMAAFYLSRFPLKNAKL